MSTILKQRNFLITQIFEISDRSLKITVRKPLNYLENEFTFEELGVKIVRLQKPYLPSIIGASIMLLVSILFFYSYLTNSKETPFYEVILCLGLLTFLTLMSFALHENVVKLFLFDLSFISFYANSPNKKQVNDFLSLLRERQKIYLLARYAKADPYLSPEQLSNNLNWLWNRGIIDNIELEHLREKIIPKPQSDSSIGFKFSNLSD